MDKKRLVEQSENAYNQWCEQWREHSKIHAEKLPDKIKNNLFDFVNVGIGKPLLLVGNGYSFEHDIDTIKKYKDKIDILCCDKSLGHLLDNEIYPTYCLVCDANVSAESYLEKYKDKLSKTICFANVCGNTSWTVGVNWKDIYFFVNKDVIHSEDEFKKLSGCKNIIPAATNVSNAMLVLVTQSDEHGRQNFFGYDKILLTGYDYSWMPNKKYYAFDEDGGGKASYMKHSMGLNSYGEYCFTSSNLAFSCEWLKQYIQTFVLPVVNCSRYSILDFGTKNKLEDHIGYKYKNNDMFIVKELLKNKDKVIQSLRDIDKKLRVIGEDHYYNVLQTI